MYNKTIEARSKGNVVATATIPYPETFDEAVEVLGREKMFSLACQQYVIKELNRIRVEATQGYKIPKAIRDKLLEMSDDKRLQAAELLGIPMEALEEMLAE